jgi:hypothetical protein
MQWCSNGFVSKNYPAIRGHIVPSQRDNSSLTALSSALINWEIIESRRRDSSLYYLYLLPSPSTHQYVVNNICRAICYDTLDVICFECKYHYDCE